MTLTDTLNACLTSLKRSVQGDDEAEMRGLCSNLNHMLSTVYDYGPQSQYSSFPSLRVGVSVDKTITTNPEDDEVYRPTARFWQRVGISVEGIVSSQFNIHQPALNKDEKNESTDVKAYKYHIEFVYTAPRTVECRIYISERQWSAQKDDDVVLPKLAQPCLIIYPHEMTGFTENGPRNVNTFSFSQ